MYHDVYRSYWWRKLKKDILDFVFKCLVYQLVNIKHQRLGGILQPLPPLEWKWDCITYDSVIHQPTSPHQMDVVWVIVDHLTQLAYLIPIQTTYLVSTLARIYQDQIVRLHGAPWERLQHVVKLIRQRLLTTQDRQCSYAYQHHREVSFTPVDLDFLNVSPTKRE